MVALIESEPGLAVSASVGTRVAALEAIRESHPDLAIVDLALGDEDGLDLVKEISKVSQFILITHNKRTMQIADTL